MADEAALRRELVDAARHLYDRGHNAPGDGNISARLGDSELLCTPSGVHKGRLQARDVVRVAFTEDPPRSVDGGRPSSELALHVALMKAFPKVGAVVHAHSPYATALTVAEVSLNEPMVPEAILALGQIPTIPYASPTTTAVPTQVLAHARGAQAFLLERHGPVAVGETLAQALFRLELLEHTAKITLLARAAGPVQPLPPSEVDELRRLGGHQRD